MSILKLKPACKDYLWGGRRIAEEYGVEYDGDILAEAWELSCHPDGPSTIENGPFAGCSLQDYIDKQGRQVLGVNGRRFKDFPILIKFIDARQNLSIQVHPDNAYALKNEGQYGKTEMWYVMDAGPEAFLYYGFKEKISREEFEKRIKEDTLLEVLNAVSVQKGDVLFIESGTIHAIGKDILIAEIQQNSNVTYRVYDYGRVGKDGKKRDLHIEKALAVTNRVPIVRAKNSYPHVADCDYFTVDKLNLDGHIMNKMEGQVTEASFVSILILDGEGNITVGQENITYKKGDSFFIPAGSGAYTVEGYCDALITTIHEKASPVRLGVDIKEQETHVGLVDAAGQFLASATIKTMANAKPADLVEDVSLKILSLMEDTGIAMDECIGLGIGLPGLVNQDNYLVTCPYFDNWVDVDLKGMFEKYLPLPIEMINNDGVLRAAGLLL